MQKKIITTNGAPKPIGPYSQAVYANNTLYVSGQVPVNPLSGKIESTDIVKQTRQVMENIKAILEEAGMNFGNVVKASIFLIDLADFSKINEVYASYFISDFPARETIQVAKLPLQADVKISVIAV